MAGKHNIPLTLMAVHAHPDDEVFGTGGIFARYASQGVRTVLVTSTLGEEGEIVDPNLDEVAKRALSPRLPEVRYQELQAAAEILHIQELRLLGYRDSGMAGAPSNNHPQAFYRATFDEAVKKLVAVIREMKPQVIVTYDAFGTYGHPDHIQTHRVTSVAFEAAAESRCFPELDLEPWQATKLYYIAMPRSFMVQVLKQDESPESLPDNPAVMGIPDELITTRVDVRPYIEDKIKAFAAHKTQIAPDNFVFTLSPEQQGFGYECFILGRNTSFSRRDGSLEQDLLADFL
jgi:N-acetyl-1-D-myo-inositol-2-amino-2-deoxy-alpha-D-glucopyranoside deacetylase